MGEVIKFPKPDPDRDEARLIREARAIYESVFPTEKGPAGVRQDTPVPTLSNPPSALARLGLCSE
jgi:hypothetical protein